MAEAAGRLERMGYSYLAVGGLVPLKATSIHTCLQEIRKRLKPETRLHLLGFAKAEQISEFTGYGIASFDSTSPLLRAFKDARANYYVLREDGSLGYYAAIRIPQAIENPRLLRAVKSGRLNQEELLTAEATALAAVRAYDRDEISLQAALESILKYTRTFVWDEKRTAAQNERSLESNAVELRRTLQDRPWRNCRCSVCKAASVEVAIFRSSNRNKRRGFHNLAVFYEHVSRVTRLEHAESDLEVPRYRRTAEC
jgi:hypothetical protein